MAVTQSLHQTQAAQHRQYVTCRRNHAPAGHHLTPVKEILLLVQRSQTENDTLLRAFRVLRTRLWIGGTVPKRSTRVTASAPHPPTGMGDRGTKLMVTFAGIMTGKVVLHPVIMTENHAGVERIGGKGIAEKVIRLRTALRNRDRTGTPSLTVRMFD